MNDIEELVFGVNQGATEFRSNELLKKACGNENYFSLILFFNFYYENMVKSMYLILMLRVFPNMNQAITLVCYLCGEGMAKMGRGQRLFLIRLNLLLYKGELDFC